MSAAMTPLGLAERIPPQPVTIDTPLDQLHEFDMMAEAGFDLLFCMQSGDLSVVPGVERSAEVITAVDGNDIALYLHRTRTHSGRGSTTVRLRCVGSPTRRVRLGVSEIVISGESGGGNLTLATTLKANRDGDLDLIAGVYAQCPYINAADDLGCRSGPWTKQYAGRIGCSDRVLS